MDGCRLSGWHDRGGREMWPNEPERRRRWRGGAGYGSRHRGLQHPLRRLDIKKRGAAPGVLVGVKPFSVLQPLP